MTTSNRLWADPEIPTDRHRPAPARRRGSRGPRRLAAAGASVLALGAAGLAGAYIDSAEAPPAAAAAVPVASGTTDPTPVNAIYAKVADGVVSVQVESGGEAASGTGFVIDEDGTIVTNAHVVGSARSAQVRLDDDGEALPAEVLGSDASTDLAVLKIDPERAGGVQALPLADSSRVRVGDAAVAVGYPLGLDRTATSGIVSGLGREIRAPNGFSIDEVIQTDAPINPGNSGGPLLDANGRVIGVNSQIATAGSNGSVGIGFAVPSNTVREVVPRLKAGQTVDHSYLGVASAPAADGGVEIAEVTPGSPAARAGLRPGDVIVSFDGERVDEPSDLSRAVSARSPGDRVDAVIRREGTERTLEVELGRRPQTPAP